MSHIIRQALIIDPNSSHHGQRRDIWEKEGRIQKIAKRIDENSSTEWQGKALCLSPGWIDLKAHFCDPGQEYKEDLDSGIRAAHHGGFTSVVVSPHTVPVIDSKSGVRRVLEHRSYRGTKLYPMACVSDGGKRSSLSEMTDLHKAGAVLFSEDPHPIQQASLLKKALLFGRDIGVRISSKPLDEEVEPHGSIHEGRLSSLLGLNGIPSIAETLRIQRDLELLAYTGGRLHVSGLSTAQGVKLIKAAKKNGLDVTAEVHLANLLWNVDKVDGFDVDYKLSPPLRREEDRKALVKGVIDGTIDAISSDHRPEDEEHKKVEFGRAAYGLALIEHVYPLYEAGLSSELPLEDFLRALTQGPCDVLAWTSVKIEEGEKALLTCFDREAKTSEKRFSKAYNSLIGKASMKGAVLA